MKQPNYYAILPAKVRYDNTLSSSQKLLFAEVTALSDKNGFCTASNGYFGKLYDVDNSTVSKWVKGLKKRGYIKVKYDREKGQISTRKLQPKMDHRGIEINQGGIEKTPRGVLKKSQGGIEKTARYNNTSNNNTRENNSAREDSTTSGKPEPPVQAKNIVGQVEAAENLERLVSIYRAYRKEMGVWDNMYTEEAQRNEFQKMGIRRVKAALINSIKNGWKKLVEPDDEKERQAAQEPFDATGIANAGMYTEYVGD